MPSIIDCGFFSSHRSIHHLSDPRAQICVRERCALRESASLNNSPPRVRLFNHPPHIPIDTRRHNHGNMLNMRKRRRRRQHPRGKPQGTRLDNGMPGLLEEPLEQQQHGRRLLMLRKMRRMRPLKRKTLPPHNSSSTSSTDAKPVI